MNEDQKRIIIQVALFITTFITTSLAGAEWIYGGMFFYGPHAMGWSEFFGGMAFSIPFLFILTAHEFGHYFTAKYYKIKVTLPYYIPFWFGFIGLPSLGTMGALIRLKQQVKSLKQTFDVGIAGPLAGFVVAIFVILYGFTHLPPAEHIYNIHPEYEYFGLEYTDIVYEKDTFLLRSDLAKFNPVAASRYESDTIRMGPSYQIGLEMGSNLIFDFAKAYIVPAADRDRIPSSHEIMHYPWLFAGFLALLFTSINLLPIGQLDGGHVLYGLLGNKKSRIVSAIIFLALVIYSGLGVGVMGIYNPFDFTQSITDMVLAVAVYLLFVYYIIGRMGLSRTNRIMVSLGVLAFQEVLTVMVPGIIGYSGWMLFAFLIGRYLGVYHPPVMVEEPLSQTRKILGWIALIIFIISFSPQPLMIPG